jgi:hypothetical protein
MQNGTITLNGVTEAQAAKILEFKTKNEGKFNFNLAQAQQSQANAQGVVTYNGATLSWNTDANLSVVLELVQSLLA